MVAAPTGALSRLGHIKTQEKHLTVIGALKLRVRERGEKEPYNVGSFSPGSAPFASIIDSEIVYNRTQTRSGCPSPSEADILRDYYQIVLFNVLHVLSLMP